MEYHSASPGPRPGLSASGVGLLSGLHTTQSGGADYGCGVDRVYVGCSRALWLWVFLVVYCSGVVMVPYPVRILLCPLCTFHAEATAYRILIIDLKTPAGLCLDGQNLPTTTPCMGQSFNLDPGSSSVLRLVAGWVGSRFRRFSQDITTYN